MIDHCGICGRTGRTIDYICYSCWNSPAPRESNADMADLVLDNAGDLQPIVGIEQVRRDIAESLCPVVQQFGRLLLSDEVESKYVRIVEDTRRTLRCSLDGAILRCYTSEMNSIPFKIWLETLAAEKSTF